MDPKYRKQAVVMASEYVNQVVVQACRKRFSKEMVEQALYRLGVESVMDNDGWPEMFGPDARRMFDQKYPEIADQIKVAMHNCTFEGDRIEEDDEVNNHGAIHRFILRRVHKGNARNGAAAFAANAKKFKGEGHWPFVLQSPYYTAETFGDPDAKLADNMADMDDVVFDGAPPPGWRGNDENGEPIRSDVQLISIWVMLGVEIDPGSRARFERKQKEEFDAFRRGRGLDNLVEYDGKNDYDVDADGYGIDNRGPDDDEASYSDEQ
jgi:hypothetical protein